MASPAWIEASSRDRSSLDHGLPGVGQVGQEPRRLGPRTVADDRPDQPVGQRPALARDRPAGLVEVIVSRGGLARSREIFQGQGDPAEGRHGLPLDQVHGAGGRPRTGRRRPRSGRAEVARSFPAIHPASPNPAR